MSSKILTKAEKRAAFEAFDAWVTKRDPELAGASIVLFPDGTAIGSGISGGDGYVIAGHSVLIQDFATRQIWDTGPGNGGAHYSKKQKR